MADNSSAADILKGLLGDDAGEKIKNLLGNGFSEPAGTGTENTMQTAMQSPPQTIQSPPAPGGDYAEHIRGLMNEISRPNDPRSQLLLSLRPYMSEGRRKSIDNAVKLLNISKLSGMFK
ncbi:MAG: hypothetical protein J1F64_03140 [Oscillospiraceae bacterium]|nr:hypothetical protein [Oscillospiraceae bacterium]